MDYVISIITTIGVYAIMALSLNLLIGYTGLLSLAHVAFFGIGAYSVAIATANPDLLATLSKFGLPYPGWQPGFGAGLMLGLEVTTAISLVVGAIMNRFSGDIYCIATLGIGIIAHTFFLNATSITQGPLGIAGVVPPTVCGIELNDPARYMVFVWMCVTVVWAACLAITRTPFGRILNSIREDELTIRLFGYYTPAFKLMVFIMSAWMATFAGGLFACHLQFVDPTSFLTSEIIFVVTMVILGGLASHRGAFLGAIVMVMLPEALRFVGARPEYAAQLRQILFGIALVSLMIFRPQGLLGKFKM
jgi:branched-chain amino acid transport system permease protein